MENPAWGQLPKSQIDPEKIEEAIARMIADHLNDPNAHIENGQSLYNHKVSEVIDHVAESIVRDKVKDFEIDLTKLVLNKKIIFFNGGSTDGLYLQGNYFMYTNLGNVLFGINQNGEDWAVIETDAEDLPWDLTKPITSIETIIGFGPISNTTINIGIGEEYGFGFMIKNNEIYAYWKWPGQSDAHEIEPLDAEKTYHFRATRYANEKVEFYIDEELVYTATENLPEEEDGFPMYIGLSRTDDSRKTIRIGHFLVMQSI